MSLINRQRKTYLIFIILAMAIVLSAVILLKSQQPNNKFWSFPHLPRPIAEERAVITTAGQGPDGLIVSQLAKSLHITHDYRRIISGEDLPGRFSSLIVTAGSSSRGLVLVNRTEEEELGRVESLIAKAKEEDMAIILIHLGGESRRGGLNEKLLQLIAPESDYMIVLQDSNKDMYFTNLSEREGIPLTVVRSIDSIKIPLNSAYR